MVKIDSIDEKRECLETLLSEMPWKDLVRVIKSEGRLKKGGFRLTSKNRIAIQANLIPKCLADQELQFSFFREWFNAHSDYFDLLEPFFNSDEHEQLIRKLELPKGFYTFNDEYFLKFLKVLKPDDIKEFIFLSPIHFSEIQEAILLSMECIASDAASEKSDLSREMKLAQKKERDIKYELKKYKKVVGNIEKENKNLYRTVETLKNQLEIQKQKDSEFIALHERSLKDKSQEISTLKKENESCTNKIRQADKNLLSQKEKIQELEKENSRIRKNGANKKLTSIFAQIEMKSLLEELQMPDEFRKQLENSVKLSEENSEADTKISFKSFWKSNIYLEYELLDIIDQFYVDDVVKEKYFSNWAILKDKLNDLKYSLSSRRYLIDVIHRILRQYYENKI